jgi:4-oxalocrotonate tautomerase
MPLIIFEGPRLEPEKKRDLVKDFAEAASRATGLETDKITTVIHENELENIGVGDILLIDRKKRK